MNDSHYIADKKIETVTVLQDRKTPSGKEMVSVVFEDKSVEVMPLARLEAISTEEQSDASGVQAALKKKVSSIIYLQMHEFGLKMGEVDGVMDAATNLVNNGYERARDTMFGVEYLFLPLNDVNDIMMKNVKSESTKEESADGAASNGGAADSADTV